LDKEKQEQDRELEREKLELERERMKFEKYTSGISESSGDHVSSTVGQLKQYGDAIRNMASKMGENSPHEFIPFKTKFDRVFQTLGNPEELRVALITPYLSERCRTLINQLTGSDASSYDVVKQYLTEQLRLSPSYFVDQFNKIVRSSNETYKGYMSRLTMFLQYYLQSRKVCDFDSLFQLLVCDKVKAS
jgi:hypothetical protein